MADLTPEELAERERRTLERFGAANRSEQEMTPERVQATLKRYHAGTAGPGPIPVTDEDRAAADAERARQREIYESLSLPERMARKARIAAAELPAGAAEGVAIIPMGADWLARQASARASGDDPEKVPGIPGARTAAGALMSGADLWRQVVGGGIQPLSDSELVTRDASGAFGAGLSIGSLARKMARGRVKSGKAGRFAQGIADESKLHFLGYEVLGASGEAAGRHAFRSSGEKGEMVGGVAGALTATILPQTLWRLARFGYSRLRLDLESTEDQTRRMYEEFLDDLQKPDGYEKVLANPKYAPILHDAAERLQKEIAAEEYGEQALRNLDVAEAELRAVGVDPQNVSVGSMTQNKALYDLEREAISRDPRRAIHYTQAREPSNKAIVDHMVRLGLPIVTDDVEAVKAFIDIRATQRLRELEADALRVQGQADETLGYSGQRGKEDALRTQSRASTSYSQRLLAAGEQAKREDVDPLFDDVRRYAEANPNTRLRTTNTKKAVADLRQELGKMGKGDQPEEVFGVVERYGDAESFTELWTAKKWLTGAITKARKAGDDTRAQQLGRILDGVWADIKKADVVTYDEALPTRPREQAPYGRPGDTDEGIPHERSRELWVEKRRALAEEMPGKGPYDPFSLRPMDAEPEPRPKVPRAKPEKGKPGTPIARPGPDNPVNLAAERTREEMRRKLEIANAAYKRWAQVYRDPIVTKEIYRRRKINPVAHADVLGKYLTPGDNYEVRVQDLLARSTGPEGREALQNAEDWLRADAYAHSVVEKVSKADGTRRWVIDPKRLDKWQTENWAALDAFKNVKREIQQGRDWAERARLLGAEPGFNTGLDAAKSLQKFVKDPEKFWDALGNQGGEEGLRHLRTLLKEVRDSGDAQAINGLRQSFWEQEIVRRITKGAEVGSGREISLSTLEDVLGNKIKREALVSLYGPEHVKLLEKMNVMAQGRGIPIDEALERTGRAKRMVDETRDLVPPVRRPRDQTLGEVAERFAEKASVFSVILGPIRRAGKVSKAVAGFTRALDERRISAVIQLALEDRALLRNLLEQDPSEAVIRRIRTRLNYSMPSLFERVDAAAEREREKKEKPVPPARVSGVNRGITAPPLFGDEEPRRPGLGRFG